MSIYVGRFAPSPTGRLHFGSVIAAVGAYLRARSLHGKILLRIEDLDSQRCKAEFTSSIINDLQVLGFKFDEPPYIQSQHLNLYAAELDKLLLNHKAFYCSCSRALLKTSPCSCYLNPPKRIGKCSIRFKTDSEPTAFFIDRLQGRIVAQGSDEFLTLKRSDGIFAYNLACVCDDIRSGVTEVVRGADLLPVTAKQIDLYKAFGVKPVSYLHLPLALEDNRLKLSKQNHAKAALDLASPSDILVRALRFLNQDLDGLSPFQKPDKILHKAAERFNLNRIPLSPRKVDQFWYDN